MSDKDGEHEPKEIVIVRRRGDGDHDDHHGGVWKVAFADFMTAMMAFFLVLWIVNSTSKETRVSVARYFNPVQLAETTPAQKGVHDPDPAASDTETKDSKEEKETKPAEKKAAEPPPATPQKEAAPGSPSARVRAAADEDYMDPFAARSEKEDEPQAGAGETMGRAEAERMKRELADKLGAEFARLGAALEVSAVDEGVLVSLIDQSDFGMFAVGSAAPEPRLVRILAALAGVLRDHEGEIVIRGHTDARPYRGGSDNWQLSISRAQAAFRALTADGLDARRVIRMESYADRKLKSPAAPEAPQNRRIEILIRKGA